MRRLILAACLICAACTPSPSARVDLSAQPSAVEPADAAARTACATTVWQGLIRAFNAGDASALGATIGAGPLPSQSFQWVSFGDGIGRNTEYTAEGARTMLLDRWARGQRLTLLSLESGAGPSWHGGVDASVRLESRRPGLTAPTAISGKTVVSCLGSRVMVVSIGQD